MGQSVPLWSASSLCGTAKGHGKLVIKPVLSLFPKLQGTNESGCVNCMIYKIVKNPDTYLFYLLADDKVIYKLSECGKLMRMKDYLETLAKRE